LLLFLQAIDVIEIGSRDKERSGCCLHVWSPREYWIFSAAVVVAKIRN
jgi:hypothetical protein